MIKDTILAGAAARASRPPLIADRCLRTQLISLMFAPLLSSALFRACLSSSVIPGAGKRQQSRAAARYQAEHQVVRAEAFDEIEDPAGRLLPRGVGNGMGGLDHLDPLQRADAVAIARDDEA